MKKHIIPRFAGSISDIEITPGCILYFDGEEYERYWDSVERACFFHLDGSGDQVPPGPSAICTVIEVLDERPSQGKLVILTPRGARTMWKKYAELAIYLGTIRISSPTGDAT